MLLLLAVTRGGRGATRSQLRIVQNAVAVLALQRRGHRQRGHGGVAAGPREWEASSQAQEVAGA